MATKLSTLSLNTDNASKISQNTKKHHSFKVLLIGEKKTGKTAMVRRFVKNEFISSYKMTVGAMQSTFECEVPIDLIEEVPEDKNLIRSMTSFLRQVNENEQAQLVSDIFTSVDPFDDDDQNAEFNDIDLNTECPPSSTTLLSSSSSSIIDYGRWSKPEISQNDNTRKTSISLQISLEIIDIGFHSFNDRKLFKKVNAVILVCDYTKKSSFTECVEKYKVFLKNLGFGQNKIEKQEYIPVLVAINKYDLKKTDGEITKKQLKKMVAEKLRPIIDKHFFPNEQHQKQEQEDNDNDHSLLGVVKKHQPRSPVNSTLLQAPNLSFIFDEVKGDESDHDHDGEDEVKEDQKKKKKLSKTDIRYINVISCSAKTGKNIERIFGDCIKKTLPSKLTQSVSSHQRTKTTAHVTAPIWLRKVFDDISCNANASNSQLIPFGDDGGYDASKVDDNFNWVDDD